MTDDNIEKRRHTRHQMNRTVRIEVDGELVVGETADISLGGVSVVANNHISNDSFVHMHIESIGDLTGHVVRTGNDKFAVEFEAVEEERERLATYIKSMFEKD